MGKKKTKLFNRLQQNIWSCKYYRTEMQIYRHAKLNNKTPFEVFEFFYEKEPLEKLGYHSVANFFVLLKLFGTKNTLYGTCLFSFLLGQLY